MTDKAKALREAASRAALLHVGLEGFTDAQGQAIAADVVSELGITWESVNEIRKAADFIVLKLGLAGGSDRSQRLHQIANQRATILEAAGVPR